MWHLLYELCTQCETCCSNWARNVILLHELFTQCDTCCTNCTRNVTHVVRTVYSMWHVILHINKMLYTHLLLSYSLEEGLFRGFLKTGSNQNYFPACWRQAVTRIISLLTGDWLSPELFPCLLETGCHSNYFPACWRLAVTRIISLLAGDWLLPELFPCGWRQAVIRIVSLMVRDWLSPEFQEVHLPPQVAITDKHLQVLLMMFQLLVSVRIERFVIHYATSAVCNPLRHCGGL